MLVYKALEGQSIYDVCLMTYGRLDFLSKLMTDNGIESIDSHLVGQDINYDESLCADLQTNQYLQNNKINISTLVALKTSYENTLGSGDRFSLIIYSQQGDIFTHYPLLGKSFLDGIYATYAEIGGYINGDVLNCWFKFDFGSRKIVQEVKLYQDILGTHGYWQWQGSDDDIAWENIGDRFILGVTDPTIVPIKGCVAQTMTELNKNTTEYRYYRCIGLSGSASGGAYLIEMEFKIN